MGNRQPMAVLSKGDWVMVGVDGCEGLGYITLLNYVNDAHLVWLADGSMSFAVLRSQDLLEPIDPNLYPLLNSTKEKNDD